MQSIPNPKVYFPGTSTPEGPQHTGPAPWRHMFHPFALLHPHHLHHQHQHPRIHKLLKLPQLNLNDAITQAHSTTFPHGLAVIRSILFRNYFIRDYKKKRKRKKKKNEASPTTLHAVPNQHLHIFPIFYTL